MGNIKSCKRCKRLFNYMSNDLCPACVQELDEVFIKVRKHLEDNPNASMISVIEETGVAEKDVIAFLKEGRLSYAPAGTSLKCEKCGKSIPSGRLCDLCKEVLSNALTGSMNRTKESARPAAETGKTRSSGMHVRITER